MKAGPEAITLILKEYLVMIRMVMMVSARGRRDIIDTLLIKFKSLNRTVLSILFFVFVFKLMLFFVIEQFCSFFFLVSSKSVLILMKSKGWILVRDLAWKINKSSSGFRIVEPK
jgi:hypothetical protein